MAIVFRPVGVNEVQGTRREAANEMLADHPEASGRHSQPQVVHREEAGRRLCCFPCPRRGVRQRELRHGAGSLQLRAGVHCGEVVATRDDVIGHVVNVAARVADSAKGNEVLVTSDVRASIGELRGVTFSRLRKRSFKGVDESVAVCRASTV